MVSLDIPIDVGLPLSSVFDAASTHRAFPFESGFSRCSVPFLHHPPLLERS
jgi:hypothetical protein